MLEIGPDVPCCTQDATLMSEMALVSIIELAGLADSEPPQQLRTRRAQCAPTSMAIVAVILQLLHGNQLTAPSRFAGLTCSPSSVQSGRRFAQIDVPEAGDAALGTEFSVLGSYEKPMGARTVAGLVFRDLSGVVSTRVSILVFAAKH